MKKCYTVLIVACLVSTFVLSVIHVSLAAENGRRPNILLIVTDQQQAAMMSCTGNRWLKTPAMDSLALGGTRFERAYAANPVCVAARFSLLTGHYPSAVGLRHNGSKTSGTESFARRAMGHVFRDAGYRTLYGGKVHLPGAMRNVRDCGFETVISPDSRGALAAACAEFLEKEGPGRHEPDREPFLLVASFMNPHDICYMAINDYRRRQGLEIVGNRDSRTCETFVSKALAADDLTTFVQNHCPPLPKNFEVTGGEPEAISQLIASRSFRKYAREQWSEEKWRLHRWVYCRLTEMVDREIGMVLDALRKSGLEDDTLIVFTSDHGDMDSAHRMEHKTAFYEEATRIPLIVTLGGQTKPGHVDRSHLVSNGIDLLPTLCDYAGIAPPEGLPGRSVRILAEGSAPSDWREDLVVENEIGLMVHTGRYKYARYDRGTPREMLLDLQNDPGEMSNLSADPAYGETIEALRERLNRHVRSIRVEE
ncbi:MAG: sulfatase-like hydrolase/transferase [Thermoguttaceae bacterium]